MEEGSGVEMPPPFSRGRGRSRRPGSKQANAEPPPPGRRAIVGVAHPDRRRDEIPRPGTDSMVTSLGTGGAGSGRGPSGRGFLQNSEPIRPMKQETRMKVILDAVTRLGGSAPRSQSVENIPAPAEQDQSSSSHNSSISSLSVTSTQEELATDQLAAVRHQSPEHVDGDVRVVRLASSDASTPSTSNTAPVEISSWTGNENMNFAAGDYQNIKMTLTNPLAGVQSNTPPPNVMNAYSPTVPTPSFPPSIHTQVPGPRPSMPLIDQNFQISFSNQGGTTTREVKEITRFPPPAVQQLPPGQQLLPGQMMPPPLPGQMSHPQLPGQMPPQAAAPPQVPVQMQQFPFQATQPPPQFQHQVLQQMPQQFLDPALGHSMSNLQVSFSNQNGAREVQALPPGSSPPVGSSSSLNVNATEFVPFTPFSSATYPDPGTGYYDPVSEVSYTQPWSTGDGSLVQTDQQHFLVMTADPSSQSQYGGMGDLPSNYQPPPPVSADNTGKGDSRPPLKRHPSYIDKIPPNLTAVTPDGAINVLKAALARLIQMPGSFDETTRELNDTLNLLITRKESLMEMVEIIFELVVDQRPFAYTASLLCRQLCDLAPDRGDDTWSFHNCLLKKCQHLYQERKSMDFTRIAGFAMFLAELYLGCTLEGGHKIDLFAVALINLVKDLIEMDWELLKIAVKVLKCTGSSLDDRDALLEPEKRSMDQIYQSVAIHGPRCGDETVRLMAEKLLQLRALNWGRQEEEPAPAPPSPVHPGKLSAEPVFYDPSGNRISREQAGFTDPDEDLRHSPDIETDDEDDLEFADAYEEFLLATGQMK